ncbi:MAG TPA: vanadium-dependent haloperoxidase [Vicinamibacterales bacterium]|nr:vanadium-dependent haloperoxidase [Vicinamibacterales bacterium]
MTLFRRTARVLALGGLLLSTAAAAQANVVLQWNEIAVRTLTTQSPGLNPFAQARFAAIVQLAVFEAVNAITGDYEGYLGSAAAGGNTISVIPGSSPDAAAISAAYTVLSAFFPASAAALTADYNASLAAIPAGPAKTNGIAAGQAAAAALMALRVGDGSAPLTNYLPGAGLDAGEWDITPGCPTTPGGVQLGGILFNWGDVKPFGVPLPAAGHWYEPFRPGPPPALTSGEYLQDYNEVKTVGSSAATVQQRSADRAKNALFYAALSPTYLFHMAARQLAAARGDSLSENARNLALLSIATNDALVASFKTKYHYKFWRPYTAIRLGGTDGNDKTVADAAWTTFIGTPCFPSYPSNHASGSNASLETLRRIYGAAGHNIALTAVVTTISPSATTLRYTQLQKISDDIDDARVYAGIHFRFDQVAGVRLGKDVATYVYRNNLQPVHP